MTSRTLDQVKALTEQCFGGVGSGCTGVPAVAPARPARANGPVTLWITVGSLYHDTCCSFHPFGHTCSEATSAPLATWPDNCACQLEWAKAPLNSASRRT